MYKKRLGIKAQITLFMLIGVVIVGGAALTFHAVQVKTKIELESKAEEITTQLLKTTALEEYITLCLRETAERGLFLLGAQGGVIYKSQNGTTTDYYGMGIPPGFLAILGIMEKLDIEGRVASEEEVYISYGLQQPPLSRYNPKHMPPPEYPYEGFLKPQKREHLRGNHFGRISFKKLCDPKGPNRPGVVLYRPCETYGPPKSVQKELAEYIINGLKECVEFEEFSRVVGYNISEGDVEANVTLTEEGVVFDITYGVEMTIKGKDVSKPIYFRTEIPIRLKKIHEYAHHFLERSANDLFFNMSNDYRNITVGTRSYWIPGFRFSLVKDACPECSEIIGGRYDTKVSIIDEYSLLGGQSFTYQFAIRNRIPALEWVHIPNPLSEEYDMIVVENSTIKIEPEAYDPDQDDMFFTYGGWKADWDEIHTFTEKEITDTERLYYPEGENQLQSTFIYLETLRDTELSVGHEDIGPHNTTLNVTDTAGNVDYQIIRVLVNDMPVADLKPDNQFSDIDNWYASIEDPFQLDASETTAIYENGMIYTFIDITEDYRHTTSDAVVYIPELEPDINTIVPRVFSEEGEHELIMSVSDNFYEAKGTDTIRKKIEVMKCLPHDNNPDHPFPYPFHEFVDKDHNGWADFDNSGNLVEEEINPYQAEHACCKGDSDASSRPHLPPDWGEYETNKVCYKAEYYGCRSDLQNFKYADIQDYSSAGSIDDKGYGSNNNDVYYGKYERKCLGDRGNKCEGEQWITITHLEPPCDNECQYCELGKSNCQNYGSDRSCGGSGGCSDGTNFQNDGIYFCSGRCGGGSCSISTSCRCEKDCGATCESQSDHTPTNQVSPCKWGCNSNCDYANSKDCPEVCLTTSSDYRPGDSCMPQTTIQRGNRGTYYCHYNPTCTKDGCDFSSVQPIGTDQCGVCRDGQISVSNCKTRGEPTTNTCRWGCNENCGYAYDTFCPEMFILDRSGCTKVSNPDSSCPYTASQIESKANTISGNTYYSTIGKREYCYYATSMADKCDVNEGCSLREVELRSNYCDGCRKGFGRLDGDKECYNPTLNYNYPCSYYKRQSYIMYWGDVYYNYYITNCEANGVVRCGKYYEISYGYYKDGNSWQVFDCDYVRTSYWYPYKQYCYIDLSRQTTEVYIPCPNYGDFYFLKDGRYESCSGTTCNVDKCSNMRAGYDKSCSCVKWDECINDCMNKPKYLSGDWRYGIYPYARCKYYQGMNRCQCSSDGNTYITI